MKVYVVHVVVRYYDGRVDSVWSTEEKAKARVEAMRPNLTSSEIVDVEEWEIDVVDESRE